MSIKNKWYFTKEQLEDSPSRRCNISREKEMNCRHQTATLIQHMGQKLVNQLCINTAIVYMHRFYVHHSFSHFHRNKIAMAALFLASKVEDQYIKAESIVTVAHQCLYKSSPPLVKESQEYLKLIREVIYNESILLQTLGFEFSIVHPHKYIVEFSKSILVSKDLTQISYFMATNSLRLTTMCLQYEPTVVACLCIYLSSKWADYSIPNISYGGHWFSSIEPTMTVEQLDSLAENYIKLLKQFDSKFESKMLTILMNRIPNSKDCDSPQNSPSEFKDRDRHSIWESNENDGSRNNHVTSRQSSVVNLNDTDNCYNNTNSNNSRHNLAAFGKPQERDTKIDLLDKIHPSATSIDEIKFIDQQNNDKPSLSTITEASENHIEKQNLSPILGNSCLLSLESDTVVPTNKSDDITWNKNLKNSEPVDSAQGESSVVVRERETTNKLETELSMESVEVIKDLLKHSTKCNSSLLNKVNKEHSVSSTLDGPIIDGSIIRVSPVSTDESTTICSPVMNRKRNGLACRINKNVPPRGGKKCETGKKNCKLNQEVVGQIEKTSIKVVIPKTKLNKSQYNLGKKSFSSPGVIDVPLAAIVESKEPLKIKIRTNGISQNCKNSYHEEIGITRKRAISDVVGITCVPEKTKILKIVQKS